MTQIPPKNIFLVGKNLNQKLGTSSDTVNWSLEKLYETSVPLTSFPLTSLPLYVFARMINKISKKKIVLSIVFLLDGPSDANFPHTKMFETFNYIVPLDRIQIDRGNTEILFYFSEPKKEENVNRADRIPSRITPLIKSTASPVAPEKQKKRKNKASAKRKDKLSKKQRKAKQRKERRKQLQNSIFLVRTGKGSNKGKGGKKNNGIIGARSFAKSEDDPLFKTHTFKNHQVHIRRKIYVESRQEWDKIIATKNRKT